MHLLPRRTELPTTPWSHRHAPVPATAKDGYGDYRPCLRWDFGFTCPFCLLHETDLTSGLTTRKTGLVQIEHLRAKSAHPALANVYWNCVLTCRFCNQSRGRSSHDPEGKPRLLDPTEDAWAEHFSRRGDCLEPLSPEAEQIVRTYKINDDSRIERRKVRAEVLDERLELVREGPEIIQDLLAQAQEPGGRHRLRKARQLERLLRGSRRDLRRYRWIPKDAPHACRCDSAEHHTLPPCLADQGVHLSVVDD